MAVEILPSGVLKEPKPKVDIEVEHIDHPTPSSRPLLDVLRSKLYDIWTRTPFWAPTSEEMHPPSWPRI